MRTEQGTSTRIWLGFNPPRAVAGVSTGKVSARSTRDPIHLLLMIIGPISVSVFLPPFMQPLSNPAHPVSVVSGGPGQAVWRAVDL